MNTSPDGPTPFFTRASTATAAIALSCIGFGLVPFFVKEMTALGIAAPVIAFYRYSLVALLLGPLLSFRKTDRSATCWGILAGVGASIGWIGYINVLNYVPVSTAGVIYMTYPLFTMVLGFLWFKSPVSRRSIIAGFMILVAAAIALTPSTGSEVAYFAIAAAFCAPISFAFSIVILTDKLHVLRPLSRVPALATGGTLGLLPLVLSYDTSQIFPPNLQDYWLIAGLALVTALVPQFLYARFGPIIGSSKTSIAGSTELPTMFVIGWLAFGETITPVQFLAGGLVIAAILISPSQQRSVMATLHRTGGRGK